MDMGLASDRGHVGRPWRKAEVMEKEWMMDASVRRSLDVREPEPYGSGKIELM